MTSQSPDERAERERKAYDEEHVWEHSNRWHSRFPHVFESPNTLRHEALYDDLLRNAARGKRVLELGCGDGENAAKLLGFGAEYVYGVDVAESFVARAKQREIPGRLEFAVHDVSQSFGAQFDMIVGRSILHHIDYRTILTRLYSETLRPGGSMIYMEPLGANLLIKLYTRVARGAHTPDERSFQNDDLRWFRRQFSGFELYPFNFVSLFAGIASSFVFSRADNVVLRAADTMDMWIARNARWLAPQFRHAVIAIRKP